MSYAIKIIDARAGKPVKGWASYGEDPVTTNPNRRAVFCAESAAFAWIADKRGVYSLRAIPGRLSCCVVDVPGEATA